MSGLSSINCIDRIGTYFGIWEILLICEKTVDCRKILAMVKNTHDCTLDTFKRLTPCVFIVVVRTLKMVILLKNCSDHMTNNIINKSGHPMITGTSEEC